MDVILVLVVCLVFSYIFSWFFKKMGLPHILGHMFTGLVLSIPFIKTVLFSEENTITTFSNLANLGLIFLLFFIGLKINFHHFVKFNKKSFNISMLSAIIPFFLGFAFARLYGMDFLVSIVIGACLSVTAEVVSTSVLRELKLLNTTLGTTVLEAGILDDIFEILILATIGGLISNSESMGAGGITAIFFQIVLFIGIIYVVRFFFIPLMFMLLDKKPDKSQLFTASFIIVLAMAAVANYLQIGTVIGALVAGVVVKQTLLKEHKRIEESEVVDMVETVAFGFLEPVFFIWIAYQANLFENFTTSESFVLFASMLTLVATAGKLLGSVVGNLVARGRESISDNLHEGVTIGWGMNARGAVELISAKIALDYGLLPTEIYAAIVCMTFITTLLSPLLFKAMASSYSRKPDKSVQPVMN